jgi:hypothetical protein
MLKKVSGNPELVTYTIPALCSKKTSFSWYGFHSTEKKKKKIREV